MCISCVLHLYGERTRERPFAPIIGRPKLGIWVVKKKKKEKKRRSVIANKWALFVFALLVKTQQTMTVLNITVDQD